MSAANLIERCSAHVDELPGQNLPWLNAIRQVATGSFSASGFPSPREDEWKYTNVTALEKKLFEPFGASAPGSVDPAWLDKQRLAGCWSLVLVDGRYDPSLSALEGLPDGVIVDGMAEALRRCPDRVQNLFGAAAGRVSHGFIAFNTAYFSDGAFVDIPGGVILEKPLQILNVSVRDDALVNSRNLIGLGTGAEASIIDCSVGAEQSSYLAASVTEIRLGENAGLHHYKVQAESAKAYHFGGVYVCQGRNSRFNQHNLAFGGLLARNEIHAELGFGAECELNGLFVGRDRQHVDNHFLIHHREPHGVSRETYRGVVGDRARGVFQGRIIVHPQAAKTSAEMNNRNLLLSDDAEIDSKPQLEILTDDVKCSHGVTIGQLDPESVFYLASRGVDRETARNMLTFAFAHAMLEKIGLESLRAQMQERLLERFPQAGIRRDWL